MSAILVLEDGTVFDSSDNHGQPLEFKVGSGQVIPGFDKAVTGMKKGEEKEFDIKPGEAYGSPNPDLVHNIPKEHLPKEPEPKAGMILKMTLQDGRQIPAKIVKVEKDTVKVDLNHPLAGKKLHFRIKLTEIVK